MLEIPQYHNNNLHIIRSTVDPEWKAGKFEYWAQQQVGTHIANLHKHQQVWVLGKINYRHTSIENLKNYLKQQSAEVLVHFCAYDPNPTDVGENIFKDVCNTHYQAGYAPKSDYAFDFWAALLLSEFRQYSDQDLEPGKFKYLYLNYNRAMRPHRVAMTKKLESLDLIDVGCVTGGHRTLNDKIEDYVQYGALDNYIFNPASPSALVPNDIYSLGRIDIWNQCLINLVNETDMPESAGLFLSEKIFKPIIGLRPFIVNGNVKIYQWLEDAGFDCFRDIFPVENIQRMPHHIHSIIGKALKELQSRDWMQLYKQLHPRLIKNRQRFYSYATEQLSWLKSMGQ